MPRCYGSPIPCWRRLRKWQEEGVWEGIGRALLASLDEQGRLAWQLAFLDGTFVAAKKGRSCGLTKRGQGSKLMVLVDGQRLPLGTMVASAQEAEVHLAEATVETVRVPRRRGRPRKRVRELVADRAYDSDRLRGWLRRRGIRPCIPRRRNRRQRGARRSHRGIGSGG
jgi:transposase